MREIPTRPFFSYGPGQLQLQLENLSGRIQIYAGAARMYRQMAATTRRLAEGGHPLPGPSAQAWHAEADRYDAWAAEQASADGDPDASADPASQSAPPGH